MDFYFHHRLNKNIFLDMDGFFMRTSVQVGGKFLQKIVWTLGLILKLRRINER